MRERGGKKRWKIREDHVFMVGARDAPGQGKSGISGQKLAPPGPKFPCADPAARREHNIPRKSKRMEEGKHRGDKRDGNRAGSDSDAFSQHLPGVGGMGKEKKYGKIQFWDVDLWTEWENAPGTRGRRIPKGTKFPPSRRIHDFPSETGSGEVKFQSWKWEAQGSSSHSLQELEKWSQGQDGTLWNARERTMPNLRIILQKIGIYPKISPKPGWNGRARKDNAKTNEYPSKKTRIYPEISQKHAKIGGQGRTMITNYDYPSKSRDLSQNIPPEPRPGAQVGPIPAFPVPPAVPCADSACF